MRRITVIVLIILILSFTGCSQNVKKEYVNLEKYETYVTEATGVNMVTEEINLSPQHFPVYTYEGLEKEKKFEIYKGEYAER